MKIKLNLVIILILILILISLSSCSHLNNGSDRHPADDEQAIVNYSTDQIFDELKNYIDHSLSAERKEEIKILQENVLKYFLEATLTDEKHKLKIYKEASVYFNKMYPILIDNIRNEQKGIEVFKKNIIRAPIWTLKEEIKFLNNEAKSAPRNSAKFDLLQWLKLASTFNEKKSLKIGYEKGVQLTNKLSVKLGKDFSVPLAYEEVEKILEFKGTDDQLIVNFINVFEEKFKKHELLIRNIGSAISKSGQLDMTNKQIKLIVKFMDYYFNKLPDDVIKTIMSELVTAGPKMTEEAIINIVFQNTGPGLGKLLQQLGKEKGIGDEFSKMMAILESSGKEVPIHLVHKIVDSDKGGFTLLDITNKPLGTGTVAQVHKAILLDENTEKKIALRFLKPGVAKRCKEDISILSGFVEDNATSLKEEGIEDLHAIDTLIKSVKGFLDDEVDLSISIARQKKAYEVYSRTVKIKSNPTFNMLEMKIPNVYTPPNGKSNLHIQEFVTGGVKFSEVNDVIPQKIVAEEMLRMWFEEALFKSGYLNADVHQGNFRVALMEDESKIKVIIYDFGLSSTLTKEDQRAFILLGAGSFLNSPTVLADGFMASINSNDTLLRAKLIGDISAEILVHPNKTAESWVTWSVQKNYFVSDKLGAFARGSALLKQLPTIIGEKDMFKDIIVNTTMKNLTNSLVDRNYHFPLTSFDIIKIGAIEIKQSCMKIMKSFF